MTSSLLEQDAWRYTENPRESEYIPDSEVLATFWRQRSPGCAEWRMFNPARRLPGQVLYLKESDIAQDPESEEDVVFPRHRGTAIWQFPGNATRALLIAGMQSYGIRVLMDVDDNYLVPNPIMQLGGGDWSEKIDQSGEDKHSLEAHARIAKFVDGIIVATDQLADTYRHLNENIIVAPNGVVPEDWPEPVKPNDGILRIGWAASHSHIVDVPLVAEALQWAAGKKDVEVYVYGLGEVVDFGGKIKTVPWTNDLERYKRSLALCDVHICPLVDTEWSRGKSDIKAIESVMAGALPIVSDVLPYKNWTGRTLHASTPEGWKSVLRWVVRHSDQIPALVAELKQHVLVEHTIDKHIHIWREACA